MELKKSNVALENELFKSVYEKTPDYIKSLDLMNFDNDGEFSFILKKEHLKPYDADKNPQGLNLEEWFAPASLDTIYLNFSDPWHKERHAKRRLTYRSYLFKYFRLLKKGGKIRFKTDNVNLFDFTLEELSALGLSPDVLTRDLHASPYAEGNVMTEYEKNFSSQGYPIHMLILTRPDDSIFEKETIVERKFPV